MGHFLENCALYYPIWDPVWVLLTHIVLYGHPCGFLCGKFQPIQSRMVSFMGHHAENFSRYRLTWIPARDPIVSYAFPWTPMDSHAIPYWKPYGSFQKDKPSDRRMALRSESSLAGEFLFLTLIYGTRGAPRVRSVPFRDHSKFVLWGYFSGENRPGLFRLCSRYFS